MDEDETRSRVAELSRKPVSHAVNAMAWGSIELDTELTEWLKRLPARHLATVTFYLDLLARQGPRLCWPHVRQRDAMLRKLRFHLDGRAVRIFYWIGPSHRIVLLTVFMKARMRDNREIGRARMVLTHYQSSEQSDGEDRLPAEQRKVEGE